MAHWGLLPSQVEGLGDEEIEVLEYSYLLYERRNVETLSDIIGSLTGTSWPVEALVNGVGNPDLLTDKQRFTWSLRPPRKRLASPLTLVVAGSPLLEQLRAQAGKLEGDERENPAILSRPRELKKKDEKIEIIELGTRSKDEFLSFVRSNNLG